MDVTEVVKILVDGGMEQTDAETMVVKVVSRFEKQGKKIDMTSEAFAHLLKIGSERKLKGSPGDVLYVTPLGFSGEFDDNSFLVKEIMSVYDKNPQLAVAEGMVRIETDANGNPKVIPYDYRATYGKDNQYTNKNFGKPVEKVMRRTNYVVYNGELKNMKFKEGLVPGVQYEVKGKANDSKYISAYAVEQAEELTKEGIFDAMIALGGSVDFAYSINDLIDVDDGSFVLVRGFVQDVFPTKFGMGLKLRDDDSIGTQTCFTIGDAAESQANSILPGYDVIVFAKVQQRDDDPILKIINIFSNPINEDYGDVYKGIEEFLED